MNKKRNLWQPSEDELLMEGLKKFGDSDKALEKVAKQLEGRTFLAVKTRYYTLGKDHKLDNILSEERIEEFERMKTRQVERDEKKKNLLEEARNNGTITQEKFTPRQTKNQETRKLVPIRELKEMSMLVVGSSVLDGIPIIGKFRIVGHFTVEIT